MTVAADQFRLRSVYRDFDRYFAVRSVALVALLIALLACDLLLTLAYDLAIAGASVDALTGAIWIEFDWRSLSASSADLLGLVRIWGFLSALSADP